MAGRIVVVGALASALILQGCATFSFAAPNVDMTHAVAESAHGNGKCGLKSGAGAGLQPTIADAQTLINNFLVAYRCAVRQVADGRQDFEVPALAIAIGGAAAMAAGAPAGVAIGTGTATAGLNGLKSYYAPKDKLPILNASVDALICVNNASVGVNAFGTSLLDRAAATSPPGAPQSGTTDDSGGSIAMRTSQQYFAMIRGVLLSIENIAQQRLSSVGSYAPDAIMTEIKALQDKQKQAEADAAKDTANNDAAAKAVAATALPATAAAAATPDPVTTPATVGQAVKDVKMTPFALQIAKKDDAGRPLIDPSIFAVAQSPGKAVDAKQNGGLVIVDTIDLDTKKSAAAGVQAKGEAAISTVMLKIDALQPKLDECVLRAKL